MQLCFKAFINLLGFKIHFASKLAFGNRFGFKTCKSLGGEHRLFAKPQVFPSYNLPHSSARFWLLGKYSFIVMIKLKPGLRTFCSSLTSVTIGDSVTSIGSYAFYGCSSLESVVIPGKVNIGTVEKDPNFLSYWKLCFKSFSVNTWR